CRAKGRGRVALGTDAVAWRAAHVGGIAIAYDGLAARLPDGTLAGSALTMNKAAANLFHHCGIDLIDAVWAASTTPAAVLGLRDRGRLAPGMAADVVALTPDFDVEAVWVDGDQVR